MLPHKCVKIDRKPKNSPPPKKTNTYNFYFIVFDFSWWMNTIQFLLVFGHVNVKKIWFQTISVSVTRHWYGKNHSRLMHAHIKLALKTHCPYSWVDQQGSRQGKALMHHTDGYSQCFLIWNIGMLTEFLDLPFIVASGIFFNATNLGYCCWMNCSFVWASTDTRKIATNS